jgi:hypothetical protein
MAKSTADYWNPLKPRNHPWWLPITAMEDVAEELTLAMDESTADYPRLTRFKPGACTSSSGPEKSHLPATDSGAAMQAPADEWACPTAVMHNNEVVCSIKLLRCFDNAVQLININIQVRIQVTAAKAGMTRQ